MSISGVLDFHTGPGSMGAPRFSSTNSMFMVGEDNNHYIVVNSLFDDVQVGQAESKAVIANISLAQWRTDLTSTGRLAGAGLIGDFNKSYGAIPCPGTPYFFVLGYQLGGPGTSLPDNSVGLTVGVRYKIDDTGTVVVDDAVVFRTDTPPGGLPYFGYPWGAIVVGDYVYAVVGIIKTLRSTDDERQILIKLPLVGGVADVSVNAWSGWHQVISTTLDDPSFLFGYYFQDAAYTTLGSPFASILPLINGSFRVFGYLRQYAIDNTPVYPTGYVIDSTGSEYFDISIDTNTGSSIQVDGRSLFGQPWADAGLNYAGDVSGQVDDDYFPPNIQKISSGYLITFGRTFSDNHNITRFRQFLYHDGTGAMTSVDTFEKVISRPVDALSQWFAMYYQISTNDVVYAISNTQKWYLLEETTTPEVSHFTFSELIDTSFHDWVTQAEVNVIDPADFDSYFITYYHMQDDSMFWMYAPYVYTYLENSSRNSDTPACSLQPRWDWSETISSNKFEETKELYRFKNATFVVDSKHKVRGKGRALNLKYFSEEGRDFNVLGWNVWDNKLDKP